MINRTKQRKEILTKSTRPVDAGQSGQPAKIPDKSSLPASSSSSKSSFFNIEEKAEKENTVYASNGSSVLKPSVQKIYQEEDGKLLSSTVVFITY